MPKFSEIKDTYKSGSAANVGGVADAIGQTLTIEFVDGDPTFTAGEPRACIDVTNNTFKVYDGAQTYTVSVTVA